ncbi:hypothetical protein A1359_19395 [Methylomonas lenta]|uniref:PEP-CTERM protein-sorting domain-containing protein n=1 Tax=Methylomonas lenta TaxID=980561 RepID=A0A177NU44_9GAMM|nr:hypothetical protein [Methylomonas lenta]OAI21312.1 hypothetical protein A1359_19395 [Methylomonas lenta]
MNKIYRLAIGAILLGITVESHASLVSNDLLGSGDGLLTYDSDTKLSWLDLTATVGQSYNQIMAGFGGYTSNQGFRYATENEVAELFSDAGVSQTSWVWGYWNYNNPGYVANSTLVSLLGITYPFDGLSTYSIGLTGSNTFGTQDSHDYAMVGYNNHADYIASLAIGTLENSTNSSNVGSFLVKDVSNVPIPGAAWLFGSVLVGLVSFSRRKALVPAHTKE